MIKVNVLEAKNRLSELLRAAQAGEEVVIANRGEPVARLTAIAPAQPVRGSAAAIFAALDANPPPQESRRTKEEIDAYLAEERAAWD